MMASEMIATTMFIAFFSNDKVEEGSAYTAAGFGRSVPVTAYPWYVRIMATTKSCTGLRTE